MIITQITEASSDDNVFHDRDHEQQDIQYEKSVEKRRRKKKMRVLG
jgi:hypothetical protein